VDRPREPLPTRLENTPTLPPAFHAALDAGLTALDLSLTPTARAAIDGHARLLLAWTTAINLTGIRDPAAVATAHVIDSLTAVQLLRDRGVDRVLDLGSGGGYPGLPMAVALPAARALLV
jgi:16S rRNA (guanine527-N7)-methyltransferase